MKITMKNEKIIKVLVADNSEFAKNNLRDFLESSEGIQLINVVDNGKDAYHFIMDEAPDIVLIDVILPVMDGFTVIEKVNANKSIKKKPSFIIISSMGNQSMVEYACKLGVLYYMMKPLEWLFLAVLYLVDEKPENRIAVQYPHAPVPKWR